MNKKRKDMTPEELERARERDRKYYLKNKDKFAEKFKRYYIKNKERAKAYYQEHKEEIKEKFALLSEEEYQKRIERRNELRRLKRYWKTKGIIERKIERREMKKGNKND